MQVWMYKTMIRWEVMFDLAHITKFPGHSHRYNLANITGGGGQNWPWLFGTSTYEGVKLES